MSYAALPIHDVRSIASSDRVIKIEEGLSKASNQSFRLSKHLFTKLVDQLGMVISEHSSLSAEAKWVMKDILPLQAQHYRGLNKFIEHVLQADLHMSVLHNINTLISHYETELAPLVKTFNAYVSALHDLRQVNARYEDVKQYSMILSDAIAKLVQIYEQSDQVSMLPNRFGEFHDQCLEHLVSLQNVSALISTMNISDDMSLTMDQNTVTTLKWQYTLLERMESDKELVHCLDGYSLLLTDIETWNNSLELGLLSKPELYSASLEEAVITLEQELGNMKEVSSAYLNGDLTILGLLQAFLKYYVDDVNLMSEASDFHEEFIQDSRGAMDKFRSVSVPFYTKVLSYYHQLQMCIEYINFEEEAMKFLVWRIPMDTPMNVGIKWLLCSALAEVFTDIYIYHHSSVLPHNILSYMHTYKRRTWSMSYKLRTNTRLGLWL